VRINKEKAGVYSSTSYDIIGEYSNKIRGDYRCLRRGIEERSSEERKEEEDK